MLFSTSASSPFRSSSFLIPWLMVPSSVHLDPRSEGGQVAPKGASGQDLQLKRFREDSEVLRAVVEGNPTEIDARLLLGRAT